MEPSEAKRTSERSTRASAPPRPFEFHEPFDPEFAREVIDQVFQPLLEHYFRPRLLGAQRIPERGPLILAANHSGNAFPYDGMVLDSMLWRRMDYRPELKFRSVFEKELAITWWMRPFGLDNFWRRCGGVDMSFDNFDRLLARRERVIYFPEGVPGIGKGFHRRYQLQPFHTSFINLAARHGAPVYPLYIINAEWVIPFSFTLKPVDWLMQKLFHVPFLPLPAAPIGILFPFAWYLTLPARMILVVGEPIDVAAMVAEAGITELDRASRSQLQGIADRVRAQMQRELTRNVKRYGRWPYQVRSLRRAWRQARRQRQLRRVLPTGWAPSFVRFERDRHRPPARGGLHSLLRDWDLIGFYLPFGWALLSAARAWRRYPCGYRGLDGDQRREIEGNFYWRLSERPLPPRDPGSAKE